MKVFLGYSALLLLVLLPDDCTADWTPVKDKEGIQIYSQKVAGAPIVMAKGVVIIAAEAEAILAVLDNNSNHPNWVPFLRKSRKLQTISNTERLEYSLFNAPWPASDRDFVFRVKAVPSNRNNILIYSMRSEPSPQAPEQKGIVRGILYESTFKLTQLEPGKTEVKLLFQADPRGWLPNWIINIIQTAWPFNVLKGLRNQTLSNKQLREPTAVEQHLH